MIYGAEIAGLALGMGFIVFAAGVHFGATMDERYRRVAAERFRREHGEFGWRGSRRGEVR